MNSDDIVLNLRRWKLRLPGSDSPRPQLSAGSLLIVCIMVTVTPILMFVLTLTGQHSIGSPSPETISRYTAYDELYNTPKQVQPIVKLEEHTAPHHQSFPFAVIAIWFTAALAVYTYLNPARMRVGSRGVAYEWPGGFKIWLPWDRIMEISVKRPTKLSLDTRTWMVFKGSQGELMKVNIVILEECKRKLEIAELIQSKAEPFVAEAEALDVLYGSRANSFTELWLETLNTPSARRNTAELRPGDQLNYSKYKILKRLGTGGQGSAYLATPEDQSRVVVLKEFILPGGGNLEIQRDAIARFVKEADLLASLRHPKVVRLFGHFFEDHRGYLILEHAQGVSLRELVTKEGPLDPERVRQLALEMCEILSYLHGQQPPVVHRDFTPDNLIVSPKHELTLVDFQVAQQQQASVTGVVVGKQSYIPLEQLRGQANPASDIYAMGATLYYLLTGQDPEPVARSNPTTVAENISPALCELVEALTEVEEEKRLTDLTRIKDALSNASDIGEKIKIKSADIQKI